MPSGEEQTQPAGGLNPKGGWVWSSLEAHINKQINIFLSRLSLFPIRILCWPCKCVLGVAQRPKKACKRLCQNYVWRHNLLVQRSPSATASFFFFPSEHTLNMEKWESFWGKTICGLIAWYFAPNGCFDGYIHHTWPLPSSECWRQVYTLSALSQ